MKEEKTENGRVFKFNRWWIYWVAAKTIIRMVFRKLAKNMNVK